MEYIKEILNAFIEEDIAKSIYQDFEKYYLSKSQRDQILFYFKVESELTNKDLNEIFKDFEINTLTRRLHNAKYIDSIDKEGKAYIYELSDKGNKYMDRVMVNFLNKNSDYKEYVIEQRKKKVNNGSFKDNIKKINLLFSEANIRPNEKDNIVLDLKDLSEYDYEAIEIIYGDFKEATRIIKEIFREDIENIKDEDIIFLNPHETMFNNIHNIDRESLELIYTKGLITSKKENIVSKTLSKSYLCSNPSCSFNEDKIKIFKGVIKACPKCKSHIELIDEDRINQLESKITDIDSGISFPLYFQGKMASKFAYVGLGDEIEVIGYLDDKEVKNIEKGTNETIKVLVVTNFWQTDYIKELTKEEIDIAEKILEKYKDPKEYLIKPFKYYIEKDFVKELFITQQLTKFQPELNEIPINISFMGEPGVGKNELIKIAEKYFPVCDSIVGADITDAGFKGTVNRETGIKEVGLAKKLQHGTLFFNEFDKFVKTNPNGKKAASQLLNASITEQEIRLNKAGIRIKMSNLDLRHNVVFNPLEEKLATKENIIYNHMAAVLDKSLLSRMIPLYIGKDNVRSLKVFDVMIENDNNKIDIEPEKYKLVIKYLRNKTIEFTPKAKEVLKEIFKDILTKDTYGVISTERIGQMLLQLCRGIARLHNKDKICKETVKYSYNLYLSALSSVGITMDNLEMLFLDKNPEEIKTIHEIKLFIKREFQSVKYILIKDLEDKFDKTMLDEAINNLKKEGIIFEGKKGEIRWLD